MELWLFIIISITALVMAILIGTSSAYLIIKFVHKDSRFQFLKLPLLLFRRNPGELIFGNRARQTTDIPSPLTKVRELMKFPMPALFAEIDNNRKIATLFSDGNLLPLKTNVWDANQYSSQELPANLLVEVEQVYADIKLLNKLVWLSTELDSQNSSMADYKKMLALIAEKIDKIQLHVTREYENIIWRRKLTIRAASVNL